MFNKGICLGQVTDYLRWRIRDFWCSDCRLRYLVGLTGGSL